MPTQRKSSKTARKSSAKSSKTSGRASSSSRGSARGKSGAKNAKRSQASGRTSRGTSSRGTSGAKRAGSARRSAIPNGLELLTEDHREVQKMFRKAERMDSGDARLQELVETACAALTLHAEIEEEVLYPALREQDEGTIEEATVEHDVAKQLIAELQSMGGGDERYKATFKVLGEYVNHHIEEEEGQVFRLARRAKLDLAALGRAILELQGASGEMGAGSGDIAASKRAGGKRPSGRSTRSSRGGAAGGSSDDRESGSATGDLVDTGYGTATGDSGDESAQPGRGGRTTH